MHHFFNLSLFILLSIANSFIVEKSDKIIYIPYDLNFGAYFINISFGDPPQNAYLAIDQELSVTWTDAIHYKKENSLTCKELSDTKLSFRKYNLFGKSIQDKINLSSTNSTVLIDNFTFVSITNTRGYDSRIGGVGLTHKLQNTSYSLIHHLKKNNYINNLEYSFIPNKYINNNGSLTNGGFIFFGGMPQYLLLNKNQYQCKKTRKFNFWSCELQYIFLGKISYSNKNNYYDNSDYSYFNGAERRILVPESFMKFLKNNYFNDQINENKCKYKMYGMNYLFECFCDVVNNLTNISFIIDDYQYEFKPEELFEKYGGGFCNFLIQSNHLRNNNFLFGTPFLNKYISNFDYEKEYIEFFTNAIIIKVDLNKLFPWKKIVRYIVYFGLFGIIIGMLLSLIMLIYKLVKQNIPRTESNLLIRRRSESHSHKRLILLSKKYFNEQEEGYELQ